MNVLEWIMILVSLSFLVLGLAFLLGLIPAKWKGSVELTREGVFFRRFAGVVLIVYGLESLLNTLTSLMGLTWPDTNGIVGISLSTLFFLTVGLAALSGLPLTSADAAHGRTWQLLFGTTFVMLAAGFFIEAMGHKMSIEWLESAGEWLKFVIIPLWIVVFAKGDSGKLAGNGEYE